MISRTLRGVHAPESGLVPAGLVSFIHCGIMGQRESVKATRETKRNPGVPGQLHGGTGAVWK